tara:strand:- start:12 stop:596 length:585 start_codon:yes stop_codon:yes gene_type:complete
MNQFCSICQNNIKKNQIKRLACNHAFCKSCLDEWKKRNKNSCPNCREQIHTPHSYNLRNRSHNSNHILHNNREHPIGSFTNFIINEYLELNEQQRQTRNNSQHLRKILITQEIKSKLKELSILNNSRQSYLKEKTAVINHVVLLLKNNSWIYYNNDHNKQIIQNRFKLIRNHESDYIKQKVDEWYYELFQTQIV